MQKTFRFGFVAMVAIAVVAGAALGTVRAQEQTPQARLSGAWKFNSAKSSPEPGRSDQGNRRGGGAGGSSQNGGDPNMPALPGAKALMELYADLTEVPQRMALTASTEMVNLIDDHGVSRRFTPNNKFEKINYGSNRASIRTHWDGALLVQDINGDAIDITRTFVTTPDGSQLTVTILIRQQPDAKAQTAMGNRGETRRYVYERVS